MRRHIGAAAVVVLVTTACSGDDRDASTAVIVSTTTSHTTTPPSTTVNTTSEPVTTRPNTTNTGSPVTTRPATTGARDEVTPTSDPIVGDPKVDTELVTTVDAPVDLAVRPGDDALHLVEQSGTVVRFDPTSGESVTTLDIGDRVDDGGERGLLGLEFSPDGSLAYTNHTAPDGSTIISEYPVDPNGALDPTSARVLLQVPQPYGNHNAGDLAFGPDGLLYIPLGDGGAAGDPERRAGDPTVLLGSLLRIDPAASDDAPYSIPDDNPFASGSDDGDLGAPEVWAWGLRNPWKIAFDPINGDLWIADVGQNLYEEINRVTAGEHPAGKGADFGWSGYEGTEVYNGDDVRDGTTPPVLTYEHGDDGCSISGGAPYRGRAIADLEPAFVYGDYCSGRVWALDLAGGRNLRLLDGIDQLTAVRSGPDGELYLLRGSGQVLRLVPG